MNLAPNLSRGLSITQRTALWSWAIALLTVVVFAGIILPQQKRVFIENLESKGQGVTVSLRDVAAGAVVNEDYSTVVDHCKELIKGDSSLDFIVFTKKDGFAIICERSGWRTESNLDSAWRPAVRQASGGIRVAPLFNRRVFSYSLPFDYSGIEWGWIHVGLSLEHYDQHVAEAYHRTGVLAVACGLFSLLGSIFYARRLVRPILVLRRVVQQVASGDLHARAQINRGDELGSLAGSVNTMTEALLRRDRILESVRYSAEQFLGAADWNTVIQSVLDKIGNAAGASRACVFENRCNPEGVVLGYQRYEWTAPGISPQISFPVFQGFGYQRLGFDRWMALASRDEIICGLVANMPDSERNLLEACGIRSLIIIPIHVGGKWWGFLGLEDCARVRVWTEPEQHSLRAAADMLGATIERQQAQDALVEAKETLERRVRERTRQLEEQVEAKESARAELAQAQVRLIEASRAAGKAEVATSVLHNVGNVLNSVSVSATIVREQLRQSKASYLKRATDMLTDHSGELASFLTSHPKGRVLPQYLATASTDLVEEQAEMLKEMSQLGEHIEHIKKIVAMQQSYAKVAGALEEVAPTELVEDALRLNASSLESKQIQVVREYAPGLPRLNVDRHQILQILINLLRNAKHAMDESSGGEKQIVVSVRVIPEEFVAIRVRDNGIGIAPENLTRIFQHGFTTKKNGHGFGLHSGANAAHQLGGRLTARSDGPGHGAEFVLELPLKPRTATSS